MKFIYTHHVRLRILQRGITQRRIEETVRMPDRLMPSFKGRLVARRRVGNRALEVVYRPLSQLTVVITAYWLEQGE